MIFTDVEPGQFDIDELFTSADSAFDHASCSGGSNVTYTGIVTDTSNFWGLQFAYANFDLAAGENITCTFFNRVNTLTVIKNASPQSDQPFTFDVRPDLTSGHMTSSTEPFSGTFSLVDDGTGISNTHVVSYHLLSTMVFTVSEQVPSSWNLDSLSCVDSGGNITGTVGATDVGLTIAAGEQYTCTFTNTAQPASFTVIKVVSGTAPAITGSSPATWAPSPSPTLAAQDL